MKKITWIISMMLVHNHLYAGVMSNIWGALTQRGNKEERKVDEAVEKEKQKLQDKSFKQSLQEKRDAQQAKSDNSEHSTQLMAFANSEKAKKFHVQSRETFNLFQSITQEYESLVADMDNYVFKLNVKYDDTIPLLLADVAVSIARYFKVITNSMSYIYDGTTTILQTSDTSSDSFKQGVDKFVAGLDALHVAKLLSDSLLEKIQRIELRVESNSENVSNKRLLALLCRQKSNKLEHFKTQLIQFNKDYVSLWGSSIKYDKMSVKWLEHTQSFLAIEDNFKRFQDFLQSTGDKLLEKKQKQ